MIPGMRPVPEVSLIICTRNRSQLLADACRSMLEMEAPETSWELLIVDNDSTDDTLALARSIADANPGKVRVMVEKEIGLSATRNAGIRAARGQLLAFLDDDAFPARDWLSGIRAALAGPGVLCAGGPVEPLFQGELPTWLDDRFLPYLTVWDKGSEPQPLTYNEYPRGANIAYRREAFERFGLFSPHLGRKGSALTSCEEIEHCLRIERGGGLILYTPEARIRHWVDASRITPEWMMRRFAAQGRSEAIIHWQHAGFGGLQRGLRVYLANARRIESGSTTADDLYRRCARATFRAFFLACLDLPLTIPRYRPLPEAGPPKRWLPFE
jgi:glycosyltransferase involved in cell wall biosynthesis